MFLYIQKRYLPQVGFSDLVAQSLLRNLIKRRMKKKKINKKNRSIIFRVTEEEFEMIKEKAGKYPSITMLILDAVEQFDVRGGANTVHLIDGWSKEFIAYKHELSKAGGNINQLAHYVNVLKQQNIGSDSVILETKAVIENYALLLKRIYVSQNRLVNMITK